VMYCFQLLLSISTCAATAWGPLAHDVLFGDDGTHLTKGFMVGWCRLTVSKAGWVSAPLQVQEVP